MLPTPLRTMRRRRRYARNGSMGTLSTEFERNRIRPNTRLLALAGALSLIALWVLTADARPVPTLHTNPAESTCSRWREVTLPGDANPELASLHPPRP